MYAQKYYLSFVSERGNQYEVLIYQQNYAGEVIYKRLGVAPVLTIEDGGGRLQGSSLTFAMQAYVEGELAGLYTTNNKEFKVELYRNGELYWIGYLLPELYSEQYVAPPYDVTVTATDQLAALKDIMLDSEFRSDTIRAIIWRILQKVQMQSLPIVIHQNLSNSADGVPMLETSIINNGAYDGMTAYDALNAILESCNCYMYQLGAEWIISSATNVGIQYWRGEEISSQEHLVLGRMYDAPVYPDGSLTMVSDPALQGVQLKYEPILKNSLLANAECVSKDGWEYTIADEESLKYPGEVVINWNTSLEAKYNARFWRLPAKSNDGVLQIWQDVLMPITAEQLTLSFKYFTYSLDSGDNTERLMLLAVVFEGADGVIRQLTPDGWVVNPNTLSMDSYITVGPAEGGKFTDISTFAQTSVVFKLPQQVGTLRVGFMNITQGEGGYQDYSYYVTDVFVTVGSIIGFQGAAIVQPAATQKPLEISLAYSTGEYTSAQKLQILNDIENDNDESSWYLDGRVYDAYFKVMLQDLARYYGVKKMLLEGGVQGKDILAVRYRESFSGKVFRVRSAVYNLLDDTANISLEEVPAGFVEYEENIEVLAEN